MNPVIKRLEKSIVKLEKEKATKRWPCNYCGSTGKIITYDPGGCEQYTTTCQACDYEWYNAGITVKQNELRNLIDLIKEGIRKEK